MPKLSKSAYEERRRNILIAARKCFADAGIHISVDDVCAAAGISKGAFYGYFKSKDRMIEALAEEHGAMLAAQPEIADRAALAAMLVDRCSVGEPSFARVELDTWAYAMRHPALLDIFVENAERVRGAIAAALDRCGATDRIDRDRLATVIQLATEGAFLTMALKGPDAAADTRRAIDDLLELALDG